LSKQGDDLSVLIEAYQFFRSHKLARKSAWKYIRQEPLKRPLPAVSSH
jgi:hypothetical protein